jgi:hypothetical protein
VDKPNIRAVSAVLKKRFSWVAGFAFSEDLLVVETWATSITLEL